MSNFSSINNSLFTKDTSEFLNIFFEGLQTIFQPKKILYIQPEHNSDNVMRGLNYTLSDINKIPQKGDFDIIFGLFPFGFKQDVLFENFNNIFNLLNDDGLAIFLMPHSYLFNQTKNINILTCNENYFLNSLINLPKNALLNTSISTMFSFFSKKKSQFQYIAEIENYDESLNGGQLELIINHVVKYQELDNNGLSNDFVSDEDIDEMGLEFFNDNDAPPDDLWHGIYLELDQFKGFEHWKVNNEIQKLIRLNKDYDKYTEHSLETLSLEINLTKGDFKHIENSVYLPLIGNHKCVSSINNIKIKHQNICQIVLDENKILASYAKSFFNSPLGKTIISLNFSKKTGVIKKLNKQDILETKMAMPTLTHQYKIVEVDNKIENLLTLMDNIKENLSINPMSSSQDLEKLNIISNAAFELSFVDKLKSSIKKGESLTLELKETLSLDRKTSNKEKYIEDSVFKTICAFLNSSGGILLVGVSDKGEVIGLDEEIKKFHKSLNDKFLLHFKNKLKDNIGEQYYPLIDYEIVDIDDKTILHVKCQKSDKEVFNKKQDFYVRTNPSTDKLEGKELVEYIRNNFSS